MAAGMGSRFGGLKQIEPIDPEGHIIIDFSLFDAWRAGFRDVVFIIKREMEAEFQECIGDRMEQYFHVSYVYQDLDRLFTATHGTYSVRLPDGSFLNTPFGFDRAYLEEDDLVRIKGDAKEIGKLPSRAVLAHRKIYQENPQIGAVLSSSSPCNGVCRHGHGI